MVAAARARHFFFLGGKGKVVSLGLLMRLCGILPTYRTTRHFVGMPHTHADRGVLGPDLCSKEARISAPWTRVFKRSTVFSLCSPRFILV